MDAPSPGPPPRQVFGSPGCAQVGAKSSTQVASTTSHIYPTMPSPPIQQPILPIDVQPTRETPICPHTYPLHISSHSIPALISPHSIPALISQPTIIPADLKPIMPILSQIDSGPMIAHNVPSCSFPPPFAQPSAQLLPPVHTEFSIPGVDPNSHTQECRQPAWVVEHATREAGCGDMVTSCKVAATSAHQNGQVARAGIESIRVDVGRSGGERASHTWCSHASLDTTPLLAGIRQPSAPGMSGLTGVALNREPINGMSVTRIGNGAVTRIGNGAGGVAEGAVGSSETGVLTHLHSFCDLERTICMHSIRIRPAILNAYQGPLIGSEITTECYSSTMVSPPSSIL